MEINLRLIMIGLGIVILGGILLDAWRRKYVRSAKAKNHFDFSQRMRDKHEFSEIQLEPLPESVDIEVSEPKMTQKTEPLEMIAVSILSKGKEKFMGLRLLEIFEDLNLYHGDKKIFHYHENLNGTGKVLFSVASACEPGFFEIESMSTKSTRGIILFMNVYNNIDALASFEILLRTARQMVTQLDGELKDAKRNILTIQNIEKIRDRLRKEYAKNDKVPDASFS